MIEEHITVVPVARPPSVFVPIEWPTQGIENLLMILARKIIARVYFPSTIVQVNNIPARLIRRIYKNDCVYAFQQVFEEEMIGAYVYNIVLPKEGNAILIEINSGSNINNGSRQNNPVEVPSEVNMTSSSLVPSRLSEKTSSIIDDNEHTLRRRLSRKIMRVSQLRRNFRPYNRVSASAATRNRLGKPKAPLPRPYSSKCLF